MWFSKWRQMRVRSSRERPFYIAQTPGKCRSSADVIKSDKSRTQHFQNSKVVNLQISNLLEPDWRLTVFHFPEFSKKLAFLSILPNFHFLRKSENIKNSDFSHFIEFLFYRDLTVQSNLMFVWTFGRYFLRNLIPWIEGHSRQMLRDRH